MLIAEYICIPPSAIPNRFLYVHRCIFGGGIGDGQIEVALDGGDVGCRRCKVAVVCDYVAPCRPSHPFLFYFVWLISADDADVGGPLVSGFRDVGGEVDGVN